MALPSFSSIELQLLICVIGVVIFLGSFLAILVSAIFGLGLGRLLYLGVRWCVGKVHHVHAVGGVASNRAPSLALATLFSSIRFIAVRLVANHCHVLILLNSGQCCVHHRALKVPSASARHEFLSFAFESFQQTARSVHDYSHAVDATFPVEIRQLAGLLGLAERCRWQAS